MRSKIYSLFVDMGLKQIHNTRSFIIKNLNLTIASMASLILFSLSFFASYELNKSFYGEVGFPPIHSNSDQFDYQIIAFSIARTGYPGRFINDEMREPFLHFYENNESELSPTQQRSLERFVNSRNMDRPIATAYRPWLYPAILGFSYKMFGYNFETGRLVNVVLYATSAFVMFWAIYAIFGLAPSLIFIPIFFISDRYISQTLFFGIEPSVGLCLSILTLALALLSKRPKNFICAVCFGFLIGLTMLSKQIFAPIGFLMIVSMAFIWFVQRNAFSQQITAIVLAAGVFAGPWVGYNVATTGHLSMVTGSSGWHDMPSAWDERIIEGRNRFTIREEIFRNYEEQNDILIRGDNDRAYYGRIIFTEKLLAGEYNHVFWDLITFKIDDELNAGPAEWVIRIIALSGLLFLPVRLSVPIMVLLFGSLAFFSLTVSVGGRAFSSYWPLIAALASISSYKIFMILYKKTIEALPDVQFR